jgi:multidrug efflux pump
MGLSMSDVGGALSAMLGGGYVNYFSMEGAPTGSWRRPTSLSGSMPSRSGLLYSHRGGALVPLSAVASISSQTTPNRCPFSALNAATINAQWGWG